MDNFYTYFLLILLVLSFTLNPFFKKKASNQVAANEYFLLNHLIISFFLVLYFIYLLSYNKCNLKCLKKLSRKEIIWAFLAGFTSIAGGIILISLVQKDDISFIIPNVQAIVIGLGAVIGYFMFKEHFDKYKFIGIGFIIVGVLFINYSKYLQKKI